MNAWDTEELDVCGPLDPARAATAVLDDRGVVLGWSAGAEELFGYSPQEVVGKSAATLLTGADAAREAALLRPAEGSPGHSEEVGIRHRDGGIVCVSATSRLLPATETTGRVSVLFAAEADVLRHWVTRQAVLRALFTQSPIGLTIYDTGLRVSWINATCTREMAGPPEQYLGLRPDELVPGGEVLSDGEPPDLCELVQQVLTTGTPVVDLHYRGRPQEDPTHDRVWSYSYYRLSGPRGEPLGVCEESFDITERYRAEQRLQLLVKAGEHIGTTLDLHRTVNELADIVVPRVADAMTLDLFQDVLEGRTPSGPALRGRNLRRVESRGADVDSRATPDTAADTAAAAYAASSPQLRSLSSGDAVLEDLAGPSPAADGPGRRVLAVPLRTRDATMGVVTFVRGAGSDPYARDELALADELVRRAAVSIDNARRYAAEHSAALTLQRDLLPGHLPPISAVDTASRYLPADSRVGVGGDWFDVIPLSGTRVGLVVGDVVGHGLSAAATMGRLRTTIRALAQLDLAPDELLTRLDALVAESAMERGSGHTFLAEETPGGTCLYGVYDPVAQKCVLARAGHLMPAAVTPDGELFFPELPAGPPLGTGGLPFESVELELPEGSLLALFTDGLVEARDLDVDEGLERLAGALARHRDPLETLCDRVLAALPSREAADDAALLLVRTRALGADRVAGWEMPAEAAEVSHLRAEAVHRLGLWGLEELAFSTELVVSELLTNAIRYATGPIRLQLIRDRTLICEVTDAGQTSPRVRYAESDDEGGRGLFLVSRIAQRWGTRHTPEGKVIWAEQAFPPAEAHGRAGGEEAPGG